MAFMGTLGARKDRVSWFGDIMYVGIGASKTVPATIPGVPVPLDAKVKLEQDAWIVTAGGGYAVSDSEHHFFNLTGGVHYFNLKTDIGMDFGGGLADSLSDTSDVLDAFVGIKGRADLSDRWYLGYYADVGTGQSDLTWQVLADFNYEFSKVDLGFGYRILEWRLDGKGVLDKFQISGPYAGIVFKFK